MHAQTQTHTHTHTHTHRVILTPSHLINGLLMEASMTVNHSANDQNCTEPPSLVITADYGVIYTYWLVWTYLSRRMPSHFDVADRRSKSPRDRGNISFQDADSSSPSSSYFCHVQLWVCFIHLLKQSQQFLKSTLPRYASGHCQPSYHWGISFWSCMWNHMVLEPL